MNRQLLSPPAHALENQLEEPGENRSKRQLRELAELSPAAQLVPSGSYQLYAIRSHPTAGTEIFGQKTPVLLGKYSEADLYGGTFGSPMIAFKSALVLLKNRADRLHWHLSGRHGSGRRTADPPLPVPPEGHPAGHLPGIGARAGLLRRVVTLEHVGR